MKRSVILGVLAAVLIALLVLRSGNSMPSADGGYLGFDRNDYPGDESLKVLRQSFSFSGYWLNNPPRTRSNSWLGKRNILQKAGFGLLVIFNGRTDAEIAEIKASGNATKLGTSDAASAISSARREGFPAGTIIFLDQEEGGRLLPEQQDYLHAWIDGAVSAGFRAGVYCSGVVFKEAAGTSVIAAENIRENAGGRKLTYWVSNDAHPPPDVRSPKRLLRLLRAAFPSPPCGNSLNRLGEMTSRAAARTTATMGTAIRPVVMVSGCT